MVACCFKSQLESVWTGLESIRHVFWGEFLRMLAIFGHFWPFLAIFGPKFSLSVKSARCDEP